ncbi:MAG: hypothetical protein H8E83_01650 [Planctomycetes bacterium]|nr:hypothetical protein [Planctomycetota bacterium]
MKKLPIIASLICVSTLFLSAEAAPRKVICENFTATWCTYCPDVANGLIMLMDEFPDTCFSMQVHGSDSYSTSWGDLRQVFYSVPGFPTVWMDGVSSQVGSYGSPSANYTQLRTKYLQRIATATDVTIEMCGSPVDTDTYSVSAIVGIENGGSNKTMKVHCSQVLHNYPSTPSFNYGCFKQADVQTITLNAGDTQEVTFTFDLDSSSQNNLGDVHYIAWAQATNSSGPAEVYQAEKHYHNSGDCQIDEFVVGAKGDYATIGEAIEACGTGDSILVMPGTYAENIDYDGRGISITSTSGPDLTVIDGSANGSVVWMYGEPSQSTVLDGFTLQNGNNPIGGGILTDGSPVITNCIIKDNVAQIGGGVYHLQNGTTGPEISDSQFCNNSPNDFYGDWVDGGGNTFDDGCGNSSCPADVSGDGSVNVTDLLLIIDAWGGSDPMADINSDGVVDVVDLLEVVGSWGPCTL